MKGQKFKFTEECMEGSVTYRCEEFKKGEEWHIDCLDPRSDEEFEIKRTEKYEGEMWVVFDKEDSDENFFMVRQKDFMEIAGITLQVMTPEIY